MAIICSRLFSRNRLTLSLSPIAHSVFVCELLFQLFEARYELLLLLSLKLQLALPNYDLPLAEFEVENLKLYPCNGGADLPHACRTLTTPRVLIKLRQL